MNVQQILASYETHLEKTVSYKRGKIAITNLAPLYSHSVRSVSKFVEHYIRSRSASPGTINRELAVLQAALRWSFKRGDIDFLPIINRLPSPAPRGQYLTQSESAALLSACKQFPKVELFVRIALMTGQRKEAILSLKWEQVDFQTGLIDFNDPSLPLAHRRKNRGIVPMSDSLRSLLASLSRNGEYVIQERGKRLRDFRTKWWKIMKDAGLDITPHILRHTVATQLAQKNVPMTQISRLLGHRSTAITERVYAKFSPDFCREAVGHLNV